MHHLYKDAELRWAAERPICVPGIAERSDRPLKLLMAARRRPFPHL